MSVSAVCKFSQISYLLRLQVTLFAVSVALKGRSIIFSSDIGTPGMTIENLCVAGEVLQIKISGVDFLFQAPRKLIFSL